MARTWRISPRSLAAYSGSRSGPSTTTPITIRRMNSQPLMSRMFTRGPLRRRGRRSVRRRLQGHPDSSLGGSATHGQGDCLADRAGPDGHHELVGVGDDAAVELQDDVAGLETGLVRRATLGDRGASALGRGSDPDPLALVGRVEDDADDRVRGLAGGHELVRGL